MPRFDSPIGSKKFEGQALKEFEVPDESNSQPVQNRRQRQLEETSNLDLDAIRDFQNRMQATQMSASNSPSPQQPQQPQTRNYNVSSTSSMEDLNRSEREIREIKELQHGRGRLSEGARRRIEMLLDMTYDTRLATLDSGVYELRTLRSDEMRQAITKAAEFDGTVQGPFEVRRQFLARSLLQVAGVPIEQFVGSNDLEAKLSLVDLLPEPLLFRLYDEYMVLVKAAREKYAIKSEEDAKEVLEDLKK